MASYKLATNKYKLGKTNSIKQLSLNDLQKKLQDPNTPRKYHDNLKREIHLRETRKF